jgi:AAA ATPase domain
MDPRRNPFTPGAGTPPHELVGRNAVRENVAVALDRLRAGRPSQGTILYGLRGVGKTVLLGEMRRSAQDVGIACAMLEAREDRSLPAILVPELRATLFRLDRMRQAGAGIERALRALAGFMKLKVAYGDMELALDLDPQQGLADSGDLETDLADLLMTLADAAAAHGTALAIFIDELQYVPEAQLAALITAIHRTSQERKPVALIGAGLPQLLGQMGAAKSYAERLFIFEPVGALSRADSDLALREPIEAEGERIEPEALAAIYEHTQGYPYFLQEWGKQCWDLADASPIRTADVAIASRAALAQLDASFFRVRFDRLTPAERRYVSAMAELGEGPHRSGDIAERLGVKVTTVAPTRSALIRKGMIYSPGHGDTAFTVPMFAAYMRRVMSI